MAEEVTTSTPAPAAAANETAKYFSEEIIVNLNNLTIADFPKLQNLGKPDADMNDVIDLLDRAVEGGVKHLPFTRLPQVIKAFGKAVGSAMNPETAQGN